MSISIRAGDREHFALVRESLASDGLHVAMVAHDRRRLQDYAAALAGALARDEGLRVEAYSPSRLEALIVDLTLHRFDAALSGISGTGRPRRAGQARSPGRPGCVLFIPDAQRLPRAEFLQLVRVASGTRGNGLRLVALFNCSQPAECNERIAAMGAQLARWDLDDDDDDDAIDAHRSERRGTPAGRSRQPVNSGKTAVGGRPARRSARSHARWPGKTAFGAALAASVVASVLAIATLLPGLSPMLPSGFPLLPSVQATAAEAPVLTRSGRVELAGTPGQAYPGVAGPTKPAPIGSAGVDDRDPGAGVGTGTGTGAVAHTALANESVQTDRAIQEHGAGSALRPTTEGATR